MKYITESQADATIRGLLQIDLRAFTKQCPPGDIKRKHRRDDGYYTADCKWDGQTFIISQSDGLEDSYVLKLTVPGCVAVHLAYRSGKEMDLEIDRRQMINQKILEISLSDPLDSITLKLIRDWVPPTTYNIRYIMADTERIKKEQEAADRAEAREAMLKRMRVDAKAGIQMINVYFEPASETVNKTVLKLYLCDPGWKTEEKSRLLGEYGPNPGTYFISVNNLVPGLYGYKVIQYLSDDPEPLVSPFKTINVSGGGPTALTY